MTIPTHDGPGLQPERTTLSWSRTVLASCVCCLTLVKFVSTLGPWVALPVGLLLAGAIIILLTQRHRHHAGVLGICEERTSPSTSGILSLSCLVVIFGAITITLMLINAPL